MIEPLERFQKLLTTACVAGIAASSKLVLDDLKEALRNDMVAKLSLVFLAAVVFFLAESAIEWLVTHWSWLRRTVLQSHYIEGWWIDRVVIPENPHEVDSVAILKIAFTNGQYEVTGDSLDLSGRQLGNFRCHISKYSDYTLKYAYEAANLRHEEVSLEGYGEYHFSRGRRMPLAFTGFIYDSFHRRKVTLQARKITDPAALENLDDEAVRRSVIASFLEGPLAA
jgi:hypothetical protein